MASFSICWDCARACGGCPWSDKLVPIRGWKAIKINPSATKPYTTYLVQECPGFKRDGYDGGTKRVPREIKLEPKK